MKAKNFLYLGYLTPIVFWLTLFVCGWIYDGYDHLTFLVSELGAIGSRTQYLFNIGLMLTSVFSLIFIIGLFRAAKVSKLNLLPILILLTFTFSVFFAAAFPLPLRLHGILGSPSMILPLSPLLAVFLWRNDQIKGVKIMSAIIFSIMMLGFLTMIPGVLEEYAGLKQRFFHIGWTLWFVYLASSIALRRSTDN